MSELVQPRRDQKTIHKVKWAFPNRHDIVSPFSAQSYFSFIAPWRACSGRTQVLRGTRLVLIR